MRYVEAPSAKEIPSTNNQTRTRENGSLEFGIWSFFGAWGLCFGVSGASRRLGERFPSRRLRERVAVLPQGEVAILAIEFFRENFHREKNPRDSRRDELPGQLRIFDPGRLALRAANGRADLGIARFPFQHQLVRLLEIVLVHQDFRV